LSNFSLIKEIQITFSGLLEVFTCCSSDELDVFFQNSTSVDLGKRHKKKNNQNKENESFVYQFHLFVSSFGSTT
jgi:hypothetical protein